MNPGQQRFHDFVMSMVNSGNESAAEAILTQAFGQQNGAPLDPSAIDGFVAQLTPLVKPEAVPELQQAAARMKEMAQHGPGDGDHHFGDHPHGPGDGGPDGQHHHWGDMQQGAPAPAGPPAPAAPSATPTTP